MSFIYDRHGEVNIWFKLGSSWCLTMLLLSADLVIYGTFLHVDWMIRLIKYVFWFTQALYVIGIIAIGIVHLTMKDK